MTGISKGQKKIGKCWKKGELFSMLVIKSIKWIGIVCFISTLMNFCVQFISGCFSSDSTVGGLYETISSNILEVGTLSTELIMIAISSILKYSRELKTGPAKAVADDTISSNIVMAKIPKDQLLVSYAADEGIIGDHLISFYSIEGKLLYRVWPLKRFGSMLGSKTQ